MKDKMGLATLGMTLLLVAAGCGSSQSSSADSGVNFGPNKDSGKVTDAVRDQGRHDTLKPVDAIRDVGKRDALTPVDAIPDIGKHDTHKPVDAIADVRKEDTLKPLDATADGPSYSCPATIPSGLCSSNLTPSSCWYGSNPRYFCRTQMVCSDSTWVAQRSPLPACTGPEPAGCPSPDASTDYVCGADGGPSGTCVYSTEACTCGFTGGPVPGWVCSSVPAGCPELPPDDGDPCSGTTACLYTPCSQQAVCTNGQWHWHPISC